MQGLTTRDYKAIKSTSKSLNMPQEKIEAVIRSYKIHIQKDIRLDANSASYRPKSVELFPGMEWLKLNEFSKIHFWGPSGTLKSKVTMNMAGYLAEKGYMVLYQSTTQPITDDVIANLRFGTSDVVYLFDNDIKTIFKYAPDVDVIIIDDVSAYNQVSAIVELLKLNKLLIMNDQIRNVMFDVPENIWFKNRPANDKLYNNIERSYQFMRKSEEITVIRNMKDPNFHGEDRLATLQASDLFS